MRMVDVVRRSLSLAGEGLASASPRSITGEGVADPLVRSLANALGEGNKSVTSGGELLDGLGNDDLSGVLVNFVVESEDGAGALGNLGVVVGEDSGGVVLPVVGVEVPEGDGLASDTSDLLDEVIVVSVGRTDERRICASDLHDGLFHEPELVVELVPVQGVEVGVRPGVGGDLMTIVVGALDTSGLIFVVDAASFATPVVTIKEESSLSTDGIQSIDDTVKVNPWAIIEGEGCSARNGAGGDDFTRSSLEKLLEGVSVVVAGDSSTIDSGGGKSEDDEGRAEHIRR